jgi:hypothetical protein
MSVVTPRCIRCRKPLRPDGTCQNPKCVRYVPEENTAPEPTAPEAEEDNKE